MVEDVSTGGVMRFRYEKGEREQRLDSERKALIEAGYMAAEERKERERRRKQVFWIIIGGIILSILGAVLLLKN